MMASGCMGVALEVKLLTSYRDLSRSNIVGPQYVTVKGRGEVFRKSSFTSLSHSSRQPWKLEKTAVKCASSQTQSHSASVSEEKQSGKSTTIIPSSEVQSLVTNICDTTSIAEFKLNLGSFSLHVKRDLNGSTFAIQPHAVAPAHVEAPRQIPVQNGSVSGTSLVVSKPESLSRIQRFLDAASDEGLIMLLSTKVGLFRRCRTIKGKLAPPPCEEKHKVKKGQAVCFIEQLGGAIPVESDLAGEVVKILRKDGEPVGYGDALIAILPSFPGIKKLQLPA